MKKLTFTKRILIIAMALLTVSASLVACNKKENVSDKNETSEKIENTENNLNLPEGENKKEEIIINENYADSELYEFEGTVDEIYDDGSILVYSPDFSVNFNYKVIVEFDKNTVVDGFELSENQHIKFDVYSAAKKSEPLTVVAAKLTLVKEVSTQREEEAERISNLHKKAQELGLE